MPVPARRKESARPEASDASSGALEGVDREGEKHRLGQPLVEKALRADHFDATGQIVVALSSRCALASSEIPGVALNTTRWRRRSGWRSATCRRHATAEGVARRE